MDSGNQNNSEMRKRHLSECDPDACEFMPLSKRINNLHLNGNLPSENGGLVNMNVHNPPCECRLQPSTSTSVVQCSLCNPDLYGIGRQVLPDLINILNDQHHKPDDQEMVYSPEMDVTTNPHYYGPNKLLFSLHIERVKRHGLLFKPNKYDG